MSDEVKQEGTGTLQIPNEVLMSEQKLMTIIGTLYVGRENKESIVQYLGEQLLTLREEFVKRLSQVQELLDKVNALEVSNNGLKEYVAKLERDVHETALQRDLAQSKCNNVESQVEALRARMQRYKGKKK